MQFIYSTSYDDSSRYSRLYSDLCSSYGPPVTYQQTRGGYECVWYGAGARNFVTLEYDMNYASNGRPKILYHPFLRKINHNNKICRTFLSGIFLLFRFIRRPHLHMRHFTGRRIRYNQIQMHKVRIAEVISYQYPMINTNIFPTVFFLLYQG